MAKEVKVKKRAEKISTKHLNEMQGLVNKINAIQFNIGKMEMQKQTALDEMKKSQKDIAKMQDLLLREYGNFAIYLYQIKIAQFLTIKDT